MNTDSIDLIDKMFMIAEHCSSPRAAYNQHKLLIDNSYGRLIQEQLEVFRATRAIKQQQIDDLYRQYKTLPGRIYIFRKKPCPKSQVKEFKIRLQKEIADNPEIKDKMEWLDRQMKRYKFKKQYRRLRFWNIEKEKVYIKYVYDIEKLYDSYIFNIEKQSKSSKEFLIKLKKFFIEEEGLTELGYKNFLEDYDFRVELICKRFDREQGVL